MFRQTKYFLDKNDEYIASIDILQFIRDMFQENKF